MKALSFETPLAKVPIRKAQALADDLGLHTVRDLLTHFPRAYNRRGQLTDFTALVEKERVTVVGRVAESRIRSSSGGGVRLEIVLQDDAGSRLHIAYFRAVQYWEQQLPVGTEALFEGTIRRFRDTLQLAQPKVEFFDDQLDEVELERMRALPIPAYPASASVQSSQLALTIQSVLEQCEFTATVDPDAVPDPLPLAVREAQGLVGYLEALRLIHSPASKADIDAGRERLRWDEAFVLQTILAQRRYAGEADIAESFPLNNGGKLSAFDANLPYALTAGQVEVGAEIARDLERTHPMHRLLQGDVGSGKTLVAVRAMLQVIDCGGQAALLAPTEVLATQHAKSITGLLGDLAAPTGPGGDSIRVVLLTGSLKTAARREALNAIVSGDADLIIGTHALLSETVLYHHLALIVVDEQHRFGVEQRARLRESRLHAADAQPHTLVMTATPIPRTLAMTQFGDLDVSTLTERPAMRAGVSTRLVSDANTNMAKLWGWIGHEASQGHQIFVVCSRIGDDAENPAAAEDDLAEFLQAPENIADAPAAKPAKNERELYGVETLLPRLRNLPALAGVSIDMLHSRMKEPDKARVMQQYAAGEISVLVATTMIEVGVNIPNATVMVVLDADRFGLSQLHQLRGRVGRGDKTGYAILVAPAGSLHPNSTAGARLEALAKTDDGFALSRYDVALRSEGDVLGVAQSGGSSSLKFVKVMDDEDLISTARTLATELVAGDPELEREPGLREAVRSRLSETTIEFLEKG